ncbi:MAG: hypothetical protein AAFR60_08355 [Pseudomonadota bacterium]
MASRLARPARIAIAGEANTGKSMLANRLAQNDLLPASVVQSTRVAKLLSYRPAPTVRAHWSDGRSSELDDHQSLARSDASPPLYVEVGLPLPALRNFELIDMPAFGTTEMQSLLGVMGTLKPHVTIFCTSATQAWKESERAAWQSVPSTHRKIGVLAVTYVDLLDVNEIASLQVRVLDATAGLFDKVVYLGADGDRNAPTNGMLQPILNTIEVADRRRARQSRDSARRMVSRTLRSLNRDAGAGMETATRFA